MKAGDQTKIFFLKEHCPPCRDADVVANSCIDDVKNAKVFTTDGNLLLQCLLIQIPDRNK